MQIWQEQQNQKTVLPHCSIQKQWCRLIHLRTRPRRRQQKSMQSILNSTCWSVLVGGDLQVHHGQLARWGHRFPQPTCGHHRLPVPLPPHSNRAPSLQSKFYFYFIPHIWTNLIFSRPRRSWWASMLMPVLVRTFLENEMILMLLTVGYDGKNVWTMPRCHQALVTRYNTIDMSRRSPSYEMRLSKYSQRGFGVAVPFLERKKVDPQIFEKGYAWS